MNSDASFAVLTTSLSVDFLRVPVDFEVLLVDFLEVTFAPATRRSCVFVGGINFNGSIGGFFRSSIFFSISCFPILSFCDKVGWNEASVPSSLLAEGFRRDETSELRTPVRMGRGDLGAALRPESVFVVSCSPFAVLLPD